VSRIERGATLAKPGEVEEWARALGAPADERRRLMALAEQAGIQLTEWRRAVAPGRRRLQEEIGAMERAASVVRLFGHDVIPGLAQTRAYAEIMFLLDQIEPIGDEDVNDIVSARLARQAVLHDTSKQFKLLTTETAFRDQLLRPSQMREQIDRVREVAALPNVEFGVIPFRPRPAPGEKAPTRRRTQIYHAFAVLGDPEHDDSAIALVETVTRGLTVRDPDEVAGYIEHFDKLATEAVRGDQLAEYLQEVAGPLPQV
jgi:hypothetical protein